MAYQNVGTPRFYVNTVEWLMSVGYMPTIYNHYDYDHQVTGSIPSNHLFRTLPVSPEPIGKYTLHEGGDYPSKPLVGMADKENCFIAMLGHNFTDDFTYQGTPLGYNVWNLDDNSSGGENNISPTPLVNTNLDGNWGAAPYNGFSIVTFTGSDRLRLRMNHDNVSNVGSIVIGTYYDMPHSPELKLTMTREMDGVKKIRTKGGVDLVDRKYTKSPLWGNLAPWEIGDGGNQALSRVGRRTWSLSFNYLDDGDVFGPNYLLSNSPFASEVTSGSPPASSFDSGDVDQYNHFNFNILDDENFFSQVIHKTNGGHLPFIFQPDNKNPDFAICKFDMKSFSFQQQSSGLYSCKLKIQEIW